MTPPPTYLTNTVISHPDHLVYPQERLAEIHAILTTIAAKQEDLKTQLSETKPVGDEDQPPGSPCAVQAELEALTTQHIHLISEQSEIVQRLANNIR